VKGGRACTGRFKRGDMSPMKEGPLTKGRRSSEGNFRRLRKNYHNKKPTHQGRISSKRVSAACVESGGPEERVKGEGQREKSKNIKEKKNTT